MMSPTLITNARIFDGVTVLTECGHVLLDAERIVEVFLGGAPIPPPSAAVVDATGCTLIPGLIDAHVHVYQDVKFLETAIRYGVTTVLDLHNEPEWFQKMNAIARSRNDLCDVKSACFGATVKNGWPSAIVKLVTKDPQGTEERISKWPNLTDGESVEKFIESNIAYGASFIKLMEEDGHSMGIPFPELPIPTPSFALQKQIVEAAHKRGLLTLAHATTNRATLRVLKAGVDGLAHASLEPIDNTVVEAFQANHSFLIPTLAVHASASGEEQDSRDYFARHLNGDDKDHLCSCLRIVKEGFSVTAAYEQVQILKKAGIDILCGTDTAGELPGTRAGVSVHHELWLYVNRCGFTPIEALVSATSKIADRFGFADRGKIEKGRLADMVLVHGAPTQSIDDLANIKAVWRNGERLDLS